jgi:hypothetical protein
MSRTGTAVTVRSVRTGTAVTVRSVRTGTAVTVRSVRALIVNIFIVVFVIMMEARGSAVVEALHYKPKVAGSIPDGVIGIFN